jgi:hypothetical protein
LNERRHATITAEDLAIRNLWDEAVPGERYDLISEIWRESDRFDADLMLDAQQHPFKILIGPVTDPPWKWIRVRGGTSFGDFWWDLLHAGKSP